MRSALLLDTCAVIWIAEDQPFAAEAREAVEEAVESGDPVLVSPMTAWEVGMLVARGRMSLAHPPAGWFAASRFLRSRRTFWSHLPFFPARRRTTRWTG